MAGRARQHERVNASIPVYLDGGGEARTTNLSPGGVFFITDTPLRAGSAIRFTIEFENRGVNLCLECVGEIVRVEAAGQEVGVAARITESRMERRNAVKRQGAQA